MTSCAVVMVTWGNESFASDSHEAGAAYYLRKPLDPDVLVDLVSKALWLPHLVQTRLSMHEPAPQPMPPPRKKVSARSAAIQGIRLPMA